VAGVSAGLRTRIFELLDELAGMKHVATWRGGDVLEERPDGTRVLQMPWLESSEPLRDLTELLYGCGLVLKFDWGRWGEQSGYGRGRSLEELTVADAVRVITALVRSDRFVDGALAASVEDGPLPLAIRAALPPADVRE
jgi:hypothetical protein